MLIVELINNPTVRLYYHLAPTSICILAAATIRRLRAGPTTQRPVVANRDGDMNLVRDPGLVPEAQGQDSLAGPVATTSLVNVIAERFRKSVINGSLKPGDEINESQLAERMGVTPGHPAKPSGS